MTGSQHGGSTSMEGLDLCPSFLAHSSIFEALPLSSRVSQPRVQRILAEQFMFCNITAFVLLCLPLLCFPSPGPPGSVFFQFLALQFHFPRCQSQFPPCDNSGSHGWVRPRFGLLLSDVALSQIAASSASPFMGVETVS